MAARKNSFYLLNQPIAIRLAYLNRVNKKDGFYRWLKRYTNNFTVDRSEL